LSGVGMTAEPGGSTQTYIAGTTYNYGNFGPATNAWQNEETVYPVAAGIIANPNNFCLQSIMPGCTVTQPANSYGNPWRFTHTFCLGNNLTFSQQFCVSEYSQDGNWLFWSSDNGGLLGSTTGAAP